MLSSLVPRMPSRLRRSPALRRSRALHAAVASALAVGLFAPAARAQGNYQSAPLGGRSALLGGTGVVLSVDGAAPFLNPATLTRIEDRSIAFSSKFFRYTQRSIDDWYQPGPAEGVALGDLRLEETSVTDQDLTTIPDTTCFFVTRAPKGVDKRYTRSVPGSHKLSLCLGKTEESIFSFDALSFGGSSGNVRVDESQSLLREWARWSGGPAWGYNVTADLAVGAGISAMRATHTNTLSVASIIEDTSVGSALGTTFQSSTTGSSWDMIAHLGATYRLSNVYSIGLSVRTPSVHVYDDFRATYTSTMDSTTGQTRYWTGPGSFVARSPARVALGIAAERERIRLELDFFFYPGMDELARAEVSRELVALDAGAVTSRTRDTLVLFEESRPVLNVGLGAEVFITPDLSMIGGLLTDLSAQPELAVGEQAEARLFHDRKNAAYASLGMVSYSDYGDLVLGARVEYADGQMAAVNTFTTPARLESVDYREIGVMFVLAGRISARTVASAASEISDVVEGDAKKPPPKPPEPMRTPARKEE